MKRVDKLQNLKYFKINNFSNKKTLKALKE